MKCSKCGKENDNNSKFCKYCGQPLNQSKISENSKPIMITVIAIVAIILIGICAYASGVFVPDVPLKTQDFSAFSIDTPEGSKFVLSDAVTTKTNVAGVSYQNKGKYGDEASYILVGTNPEDRNKDDNDTEFVENDGNIKIYKSKTPDATGTCYITFEDKNGVECEVIGYDLKTVKRMAETFKVKDIEQLKQNVTALNANAKPATSSQASSSSTPSSMNIIGGSFSTGSGDGDKTYASINVGKQHAGENVIVQIWYSRDGNTLNNGNMVPATVHSDGYLEISSADAYKYYPDHATINIYDSNSKLLTTTDVTLSPTSGTQTF